MHLLHNFVVAVEAQLHRATGGETNGYRINYPLGNHETGAALESSGRTMRLYRTAVYGHAQGP